MADVDPGTRSPWDSVAFMLSTLGYAVSRRFFEALAPAGLEPRQFLVLRTIALEEGPSQQALARRLQIPKSRMVAIVDGLERRGLLERRRNPGDRRAHALHLTEEGQALARTAFRRAVEHEQRITSSLGADERRQLLDLLARIATDLGIPRATHSALADPPGRKRPGR